MSPDMAGKYTAAPALIKDFLPQGVTRLRCGTSFYRHLLRGVISVRARPGGTARKRLKPHAAFFFSAEIRKLFPCWGLLKKLHIKPQAALDFSLLSLLAQRK
jgi:hypothetical protein